MMLLTDSGAVDPDARADCPMGRERGRFSRPRFDHDAASSTTYPFDGWTVAVTDHDKRYGSSVVWGCERPELLISETLAFHDLRTEDLDDV